MTVKVTHVVIVLLVAIAYLGWADDKIQTDKLDKTTAELANLKVNYDEEIHTAYKCFTEHK